ncbi:hypothetical protein GCM10010440_46820 [Kitasatospora cinereorecta]|uniref:Uncharacterized protein n=1 Tax=Kitasatospora paracochleata TaxID=58354 RepID=A0ABT1J4F1_9ACTN|nr:hypothetical protein [Kitasatospora paracochleata]
MRVHGFTPSPGKADRPFSRATYLGPPPLPWCWCVCLRTRRQDSAFRVGWVRVTTNVGRRLSRLKFKLQIRVMRVT